MTYWNQLTSDLISALVPIILGAIVFGARAVIVWMQGQKNAVLHTMGELVYREVEDNFGGVAGAQKLQIAIEKLKTRLGGSRWANSVDDATIIQVLQKAWYNHEGQYKNGSDTNAVASQLAAWNSLQPLQQNQQGQYNSGTPMSPLSQTISQTSNFVPAGPFNPGVPNITNTPYNTGPGGDGGGGGTGNSNYDATINVVGKTDSGGNGGTSTADSAPAITVVPAVSQVVSVAPVTPAENTVPASSDASTVSGQ
jgi:hypothetical protein